MLIAIKAVSLMYEVKQLLVLLALVVACRAAGDELVVMDFASTNLTAFKQQSFKGSTDYQRVQLDGETVLQASTRNTASALYHPVEIDLTHTPYLNWRWRVENSYSIDNQQIKSGDDYPARIYVVFKLGIFPWQTRALNYVWSNTASQLPYWPNPFSDKAIMIPLRSPADELGQWRSERVNVAADYYRIFGERITTLQGVALMSDSDNSGGFAVAYYGNISFSN
jgi:hypothetical protein